MLNTEQRSDALTISTGSVMGGKWKVVKTLDSARYGHAYEVQNVDEPYLKAALKAETHPDAVTELKVEAEILKRLKGRDHIATLLAAGQEGDVQFMVTTLIGQSLWRLIGRTKGTCSISTQTRIGLQVLHGLKAVHDVGFVVRDVSPANLVLGGQGKGSRLIHIHDFAFARQYVIEKEGRTMMRRPREHPPFRGTTRYSSANALCRIEQGRCDDLWSLLYVMAECRNRLPWANIISKNDVVEKKRATPDQILLKDCPIQLLDFAQHLRSLTYYHRPDYMKIYTLLDEVMTEGEYSFSDPWDWERNDNATVDETPYTEEWAIEPMCFVTNPYGF